jgi:uncharacterized protein (DUF58 family)
MIIAKRDLRKLLFGWLILAVLACALLISWSFVYGFWLTVGLFASVIALTWLIVFAVGLIVEGECRNLKERSKKWVQRDYE